MDHHAAVVGDDANGLDRLLAALGVKELQGDVTCRADMDPMVLPIDP